nr:hypothetical protein [Solirubrobacter pauli]
MERGQGRDAPAHQTQQLVQSGVGQVRLGLHADRRQHTQLALLSRPHRLRQHARLPDPRLAPEDQRVAPRVHRGEQRREHPPFRVATDERHGCLESFAH